MVCRRTLDQVPRLGAVRNSDFGQPVFSRLGYPLVTKLKTARPEQASPNHVQSGHQLMSDTATLLSLIVGICEQDPKRWHQFNDIYRPMMMDYLRKRGLPPFAADDVVQDVFVKLLGKIATYDRTKCSFRSWLFTVVNNTLIDRARHRASEKKKLEGWVLNVLRATPSDSVKMEETWLTVHKERILKTALKTVRARVSARTWDCFMRRSFSRSSGQRDRPRFEHGAQHRLRERLPSHEARP